MRNYEAHDIFRYRALRSLSGHCDHRNVVFTVSLALKKKNGSSTRIWFKRGGEKPRPITSGQVDAKNPLIDATGTRVYFLSSEAGKQGQRIFVLRLDGGEAEALGAPAIETLLDVTKDGNWLLAIAKVLWAED